MNAASQVSLSLPPIGGLQMCAKRVLGKSLITLLAAAAASNTGVAAAAGGAGPCVGEPVNGLMFVVDSSESMQFPAGSGFAGSRLDVIKAGIAGLLDAKNFGPNDRTGLQGYNHYPYGNGGKSMDEDHAFTRSVLLDLPALGGTGSAGAMYAAVNSFRPEAPGDKIIVHISDGDADEAGAIQAAAAGKQNGIEIYTIAVGSPRRIDSRPNLQQQASLPTSSHYRIATKPADFLLPVTARGGFINPALDLSANAFPIRALNLLPRQPNELTYVYSTEHPETNLNGGSRNQIPSSLPAAGLSVDVTNASASGFEDTTGARAGSNAASGITRLSLVSGGKEVLHLEAIKSVASVDGNRVDGHALFSATANAEFGVVKVGRQQLGLPIPPNTRLDLPTGGYVVLNEQLYISNSGYANVNAVHVHLDDANDVVIGHAAVSASCGYAVSPP